MSNGITISIGNLMIEIPYIVLFILIALLGLFVSVVAGLVHWLSRRRKA